MATILAYTSPALGHLFPISALLSELSRRGHKIHLRTRDDTRPYSVGLWGCGAGGARTRDQRIMRR